MTALHKNLLVTQSDSTEKSHVLNQEIRNLAWEIYLYCPRKLSVRLVLQDILYSLSSGFLST